ncbi:DUF3592 domain-containing protein [Alkanindiges illinoisensis]|uniref:DUF3592 domain-containing protein n=1 Tax=Alkanindiges illinoisensis TaxID=197183 RepID=A0A4Y7XDI3_9GAMM|nr:DUF3592 domain-containing protein [Alkanindiges illinoisensis]TEU28674.1 hypothetical protein E2B99_05375 [Alkanindiges illinoisensis]
MADLYASLRSIVDQPQKLFQIIFKVLKYLSLACLIFCAIGLTHAIKRVYPLWVNGAVTQGIIVAYQPTSWHQHSSTGGRVVTTQLPIVEFTVNKKPVRFTDHFGHDIQHLQATVPVIYATNKPELAIMDKGPLKNWLEVYIWLFGLLCGVLGLKRFNQIRVSDL